MVPGNLKPNFVVINLGVECILQIPLYFVRSQIIFLVFTVSSRDQLDRTGIIDILWSKVKVQAPIWDCSYLLSLGYCNPLMD